jgi:hypothetical protein
MATRADILASAVLCAAVLSCASGCLDNKLDPSDAPTVYLAQQTDFADYLKWMAFPSDVTEEHGGVIGTTTIYVKELPPANEHAFPVGALVVKTMKAIDSDTMTIHAMAKRGSGFNADGALGWEYFELILQKNGTPAILWRGEQPPSGEMYQSLLGTTTPSTAAATEGNCNDCHASGTDGMLGNDIVDLIKRP